MSIIIRGFGIDSSIITQGYHNGMFLIGKGKLLVMLLSEVNLLLRTKHEIV